MRTHFEITRWREKPRGLAYRRWVIASTGLRHLLRMRFFRVLIAVAWAGGLGMAVVGFVFSQSIASGGWLEQLAAQFGPRPEAVLSAFTALVLLYPDIIVHGLFTLNFYGQSIVGLGLSLVGMTILVPRLVAHDRATSALTIYLSRPLTSIDYLLGKFGIILGILLAVWTGPLLFGWALSVLFTPDRIFLVHSIEPLGRALLFNLIGLVVVSAIALGISSSARKTSNTILLWIGAWIVLGHVARFPFSPDWLRHASFTYDLEQVRRSVFQLDVVLMRAGDVVPRFNEGLADGARQAGEFMQASSLNGAMAGLAILVGLSTLVFFRKLRPE